MPLQSSETPLESATTHALDDGPVLEGAALGSDTNEQTLRIRARRFYPVAREDLFGVWTRRTAWDSWMRLRARSRSTLSCYRGGAFRLELAEGPTIHLVTGTVNDIRPDELLSLSWIHHNSSDHGSVVDVEFRSRQFGTDLTLVHRNISSRREASWLMRLWSVVLVRLGNYVLDDATASTRRIARIVPAAHQPGETERRTARGPFTGPVAYAALERRA
jgi:uncharacterized protein YndB with AHSA1/START domain